jgi:hypothetical protein
MNAPSDDRLEGLRMVEEADVYKAGQHAGILIRNQNGIEFRYLDTWIAMLQSYRRSILKATVHTSIMLPYRHRSETANGPANNAPSLAEVNTP